MKALIICPSPRPTVALLAETAPLAIVPLLGKCLLEYWIEYLEGQGVRDIHILAADRAGMIEAIVGDGTRWGINIRVESEPRESTLSQATEEANAEGKPKPAFIVQMDHLPGRSGSRLFESYATWFAGLYEWIPLAQTIERIGQYEIEPGVWVGLRPRIHESARFLAPCWLGDHVAVNSETVIGPGAIIESGVIVGAGAHVSQSIIGPSTFVGVQTRIENSIAHRHTLVNWSTNSCLKVPDACWLSSLRSPLCEYPTAPWQGSMQIENDGATLHVSQLGELSASNSTRFIDTIRESMTTTASVIVIEIDLACTRFMDSCGLATLCSLQRITATLGIRLRLRSPLPAMQQLLELTKLHELFDIDHTNHPSDAVPLPVINRTQPVTGTSPEGIDFTARSSDNQSGHPNRSLNRHNGLLNR